MSTSMTIGKRLAGISRELKLFAIASITMGVAYSLVDSTFNNFLNDKFDMTGFQRSFLEFPRELPGFLVVFVSALLWFLCSRRLGVVSMLLGAVGSILIGFASSSYGIMIVWLFIYSMGNHIFLPLSSTIGMELSTEGKTGKRLGQLNAIRNLATICGSILVFIGFRFLNFSFQTTFVIATIFFLIAAVLMYSMTPEKTKPGALYFKFHREYRLYYTLAVLYGSRKQIFLTFAPWVLVTIFNKPTTVMATLYTIGGIIGILFQPFLGKLVDKLGERAVLSFEAIALIFVCFGYGFSKFLFTEDIAFYVACVCFLLDQMLMSVGMARSTYMKKIALQPEDIQPALTVSVTIDHVFSILTALLCGVIWNYFGYQYVFMLGACIAIVNFFFARQVRVPKGATPSAV